jgi:sugar/nucleoside kinase (ribokinase family)
LIALLGNLSRDLFPGEEPRVGGAPFHAARALRLIGTRAQLYVRCALEDRDALVPGVSRLGTPVHYVPGTSTVTFRIEYEGDRRMMQVDAIGDTWLPEDLPALPHTLRWLHVGPLLRSDFPPETLAVLGRGRNLSLDGQGLVRASRVGELAVDADYDPELLRHVRVLKLADDEAEVIGDPAALPVPEVIATHGPRGSTVYAGGTAEHVPAFGIDAEPTGAGDAFSIAYVAARAGGMPPVAAARRATAVVAELLSYPGDRPEVRGTDGDDDPDLSPVKPDQAP